ncbi:hypothetical protein HLH17_11650 [Acinetobacter sp. ANC 5380]|uniref:Uncharacterized protein n=1 Tax=Acinetobacter terrae TaxID=2731247 RepID=A0A7Y2RGK5_9GAMM|nr:hypothetical protein [Acinetobacter terrae]NNH78312.1 hypothetical protein [Acinetobacter terrae]
MKDKKELVYDLAGTLAAILFGCVVVIFIIVNIPGTTEIDGSLIANVLVGGVTLFAPLAAYHLLTDWKVQHNTSIEKEYLKEIFDELRKYNRKVFKYVDKANDFILHENNFGTGNLFKIDKTDLKDYQDSYNHLLTILGEYKILSKDKNIVVYANNYDNLARNTYAIFEGINNIKIEFKRNIYGEIEETEEEIKQKKKSALKDFLMKKQSLTLSGETKDYTYWLILDKFKDQHNKFYTYLIEKKLIK